MSEDDEIGYGKPPKKNQFQKGQSGNPKGRPKGKKNRYSTGTNDLNEMIRRVAATEISVTDGGQLKQLPIFEVAIKTAMAKAAKGDLHAFRACGKMVSEATEKTEQKRLEALSDARTYFSQWPIRCRNEFRMSDPFSLPLPHPDHLDIDFGTGEVSCDGPITKQQMNNFMIGVDAKARLAAEVILCKLNGIYDHEEFELVCAFYVRFSELIPDSDPIWKIFGPDLIDRILDHRVYYAEKPVPWDLDRRSGPSASVNMLSVVNHSETTAGSRRSYVAFRKFMREKVMEEMDDIWIDRLKSENLKSRDIELDVIMYRYEMGRFSLDDFEFTSEETAKLEDPVALRGYMQWDHDS